MLREIKIYIKSSKETMLDLSQYGARFRADRFCDNGKPPIWGPIVEQCLPAGSFAHPTKNPNVTAIGADRQSAARANCQQGAVGNVFSQMSYAVPQVYLQHTYAAAAPTKQCLCAKSACW